MNKARDERALRAACGLLLWGAAALGCSSSAGRQGADDRTDARCAQVTCAQAAAPTDWTKATPLYTAHVRVLDLAGRPLKSARLELDDRSLASDEKGRASFEGLPAKASASVRITADDHAPQVTTTDAFRAGQRTQDVTLVRLKASTMVDLQQQASLQEDGARVELEPRSLAYFDGRRGTLARAEMTALPPSKLPRSAQLETGTATDKSGAPAHMGKPLGVLYARFTDPRDVELNLTDGRVAGVELSLGEAAEVEVGETLSLYSLEERSGVWREGSSCKVAERRAEGRIAKVCKGHVPHFSFWAAARPAASEQRGSLGCLSARARVDVEACLRVEVESIFLGACDAEGARCALASYSEQALLPADEGQADYCGVLERAATQRVGVLYDVDASACPPELGVASGRRIKLSEPFSLDSFGETPAGALLRDFTADPASTCASACRPLELAIAGADLASPVVRDVDDDGHYASEGQSAALFAEAFGDCDDADPLTYVGAPELFCAVRDQNCDGRVGAAGLGFGAVADPAVWNANCGLCSALGGLAREAEQPGNDYDEDCDGSALDRDGDGQPAPADCDDADANVAPGLSEVLGNFADEDCDGAAVDRDGDGVPGALHVYLAERLGLERARFVDCDDYDPEVRPGRPASDEAGALASYYYELDGERRRRAEFCALFESDGSPNLHFHALARDLNCDGALSDVDGDGFAALGDQTLGSELALDCDDFDPRIAPRSSSEPSCSVPFGLANDAACEVADEPASCPALTLSGVVLATRCEEAKNEDGSGTGIGVCGFDGWSEGDPLSFQAGALWGPCDGARLLPDCPPETQCGGPLPYSEALNGYLERAYTEGVPLTFKGTCFPKCEI